MIVYIWFVALTESMHNSNVFANAVGKIINTEVLESRLHPVYFVKAYPSTFN